MIKIFIGNNVREGRFIWFFGFSILWLGKYGRVISLVYDIGSVLERLVIL